MRTFAVALIVLAATMTFPAGARAEDRARKYYYEDILEPFFAPDPARPGWLKNARPGSKPGSFPAVKAPGAVRVFILGGSIAGLLDNELQKALSAALPGRTVEVLNCGMAGYDSYREALVEQEVLEYAPDLLVFLSGHNEGLGSAPVPIWVMRAQDRLGRFKAFRALVRSMRDSEEPKTEALADARDAAFERNLAENIRRARALGVAVAVVVPPRNWREPVELGPTPYDAGIVGGWLKFVAKDYAGARAEWKAEAAKSGDVNRKAFLESFIARCEEKLGLWEQARDSFMRSAALDRSAICGPRCQGFLRAVSKKEGAFLVEADAMFRAFAAPRLPGLETFNDRMHWRPRYNCLMASEIFAAARARPELSSWGWDDARFKKYSSGCEKPGQAASEEDDQRILGYVVLGLSQPTLRRLSTVTVFYLQTLHQNRPSWFRDLSSLVEHMPPPQASYGAPEPGPSFLPRLYWHDGEARLLEGDKAAAIKDFKQALRLDANLPWTRLSLAIATREGLPEAAAAATEDQREIAASARAAAVALGLSPAIAEGGAEGPLAEAEAASAAGKKKEALDALARARAASPEPHQLRRIGQVYMRLHEHAKFLEISDAVSKAYPDDVDFWLARAAGCFQAGRKNDGLEALANAERLNPPAPQRRLLEGWRKWLADGARPGEAPL